MAQSDTLKPYQKNINLPDFTLLSSDSIAFVPKNNTTGKNIVLMLFSPDCDHCQKQLEEFLSIKDFADKAELVIISVYPLYLVRDFYKKFKLAKYSYINLGQDYKGFCIPFYKPHTVPVLVFYNKQKQFVAIHQGNADKKAILAALKD